VDIIGYYINCDEALCADCANTEGIGKANEKEAEISPTNPAPIYRDTEADAPTHCARCQVLIPHQLTSAGLSFIADVIATRLCGLLANESVVAAWWRVYGDQISDDCIRDTIDDWATESPHSDDYVPKK